MEVPRGGRVESPEAANHAQPPLPGASRLQTMSEILGIHHVTAIASDPQRNVDFYAGVLGLRLVKRTVNFDDPTTYHF